VVLLPFDKLPERKPPQLEDIQSVG